MPLIFDQQMQCFRFDLDGQVDMQRVFKLLNDLFAHPDFRPGVSSIWDARNADLSPLKAEDIRQFRAYQAQHADARGQARIALVAGDNLSFGLGRMFELTADLPNLHINVFRDMNAAETWVLARS
jgi:hypothetical protein